MVSLSCGQARMTRLSDGASDGRAIMLRFWSGSCNRVETRDACRATNEVMGKSCDFACCLLPQSPDGRGHGQMRKCALHMPACSVL